MVMLQGNGAVQIPSKAGNHIEKMTSDLPACKVYAGRREGGIPTFHFSTSPSTSIHCFQ